MLPDQPNSAVQVTSESATLLRNTQGAPLQTCYKSAVISRCFNLRPACVVRLHAMGTKRIDNYPDFWLHYLREHSLPQTRAMHCVGTSVGIVIWLISIYTVNIKLAPLGLVAGKSVLARPIRTAWCSLETDMLLVQATLQLGYHIFSWNIIGQQPSNTQAGLLSPISRC